MSKLYNDNKKNWSMEDLVNAVNECKQGSKVRPVARKYGIPKSTLHMYYQKYNRIGLNTIKIKLRDIRKNKIEINANETKMLNKNCLVVSNNQVNLEKPDNLQEYQVEITKTKPSKIKVPRRIWSHEILQKAIEECKQGGAIRKIAQKYGIPKSTLHEHKNNEKKACKRGMKSIFSEQQEKQLIDILIKLANEVQLTNQEIRSQAFIFAELHKCKHNFNRTTQQAGSKWLKAFLQRNAYILKLLNIDEQQSQSDTNKKQYKSKPSLNQEDKEEVIIKSEPTEIEFVDVHNIKNENFDDLICGFCNIACNSEISLKMGSWTQCFQCRIWYHKICVGRGDDNFCCGKCIAVNIKNEK